ncbi:MAG: polysaccharide biosynthesis tyrosine autokinase [Bacteroidetes bacterium]|nr:polysaccharide biosynthesis tyrosine autokinase [Bacteroidota bacterium]
MATDIKKIKKEDDENILRTFMFRYIPHWPLFAILAFLSLVMAWAYLKFFTVPNYKVNASILVKDERKGVEDSKTIEALNTVGSKTIAENEVSVIGSKQLIKDVVLKLKLYAPVLEEDYFKTNSAYTTSPIIIEAKDPANIVPQKKVYFQFNNNQVVIANNRYNLDHWVETPFGVLKFSKNIYKEKDPVKPLFFLLQSVETAVANVSGSLEVAGNKLSSVITLTLGDEVPVRGKNILNSLIDAYNQNALNEKNILASNTIAFLNERVKQSEEQLDSIEQKVKSFRSSNQVIDLSEQSRQYLQNVGENDRKLTDINTQLTVLDEVEKYVRSKNNSGNILPSTLGVSDPTLANSLEKLNNAEVQYEKLKGSVGENNPILSSVANEIEKYRPSILETISSQRKNLMASKSNLNSTNSGYSQILQTIPGKEKELTEIIRQKDIKNQVYAFLLQKREEAQLRYAQNVPDTKIVDPAQASFSPVSPKRNLIYFFAFGLAFVAGITYITLRETLTNKIVFRSEIEEFTTVPVIAEITFVSKPNLLNRFSKQKKIAVAEQFRQLRMALKLYRKQALKKRLLVTSSIGGEGKSFISNNLAKSIASSGKKVVLIDFDMRNPKTSSLFNLSNKSGIKEYLEGEKNAEDIIQKTEYENLFVIPAGEPAVNPTELLLSSALGELFDYLEHAGFDYIIADTAPVQPVTDAYIVSEFCDTTLFVVRHRYTPKAMIKLLNENNKIKALKNLNIIFNGVKSRGVFNKTFGYGYGYGYEYGYTDRKYIGNPDR